MKIKLKFCLAMLFSLQLCLSWSQPYLLSSGHATFNNQEISLAWTLGEFGINRFDQNSINLELGFHATSFPTNSTSTPRHKVNKLQVTPNPTARFIQLEHNDHQIVKILFYDCVGKVVKTVINPSRIIDIKNLNSGIYFILSLGQNGVKFKSRVLKL